MKTPILIALLLATSAVPFAQASDVTVTLDVDAFDQQYKACEVTVPAGANGGDVLDAAVASGCILLWTADEFEGFGRYVVCIDALCGIPVTFWEFWINGEFASIGIDSYRASHGDVLRFNYDQWPVAL